VRASKNYSIKDADKNIVKMFSEICHRKRINESDIIMAAIRRFVSDELGSIPRDVTPQPIQPQLEDYLTSEKQKASNQKQKIAQEIAAEIESPEYKKRIASVKEKKRPEAVKWRRV
jgi:arginine decarboxylase-like protein